MAHQKKYQEIVGCMHIHSTYSDGSAGIPEIAEFARQAGLDFIMMTDHNNLKALKNNEEGWHQNLLKIIGYEINDVEDKNHYLAFGLSEEVDRYSGAPAYVKAVKAQGGLGIIAHPDEKRNVMLEHPPYPWTAWQSEDFQGIEIWNQMSEWMEGLSPWNKLWRVVHPRKSIIGPTAATLKKWDALNQGRPVVGIGGVDAHAHIHKMFGGLIKLTIFPYKVQFKTIRTHLLIDGPWQSGTAVESAKNKIYDAIRHARVFVSNHSVADAGGFRLQAISPEGTAETGESLKFNDHSYFKVVLPRRAEILLIRNGSRMMRTKGSQAEIPIGKAGIYRVVITIKGRPWIYSNHIRITNGIH